MIANNEKNNVCEECEKETECEPYFQEQHGFSVCEACIIEKFKDDNL